MEFKVKRQEKTNEIPKKSGALGALMKACPNFNFLGIICEPSKGTSKVYLGYSSLGNLVGAT